MAAKVPSAKIIEEALAKVPEVTKAQAYVAYLGFSKALKKIHGVDAEGVVKLANQFSEAMGLEEPPYLEKSTIGKMGLKGVPGIRVMPKGSVRPNASGRPNAGPKKQRLDEETPTASASETQDLPVGEPRTKKPKREGRGRGRVIA